MTINSKAHITFKNKDELEAFLKKHAPNELKDFGFGAKKQSKKKIKISYDNVLFNMLKQNGLPIPIAEYKFCETRKWRVDYAWINEKLILEVEGGIYMRGRHVRPTGFINDIEKYNKMTELGWRLIRATPKDLTTLKFIENLKILLNNQTN